MSPKRTTWHMRQFTVYEQFGCINMRAVTFSFVDQSSSRGLKKFGEKIPTSPISPEVIHVHRLNFKPNFKFSRLKFFWLEGPPSQLGCALGSLGQSLAHVKISGRSPPPKGENSLPKNAHYGGSILTSINFSFVDQTSQTFQPNIEEVVVDQLLFRFSICASVPEIFAIKVESCEKSRKILDGFFGLPNFTGQAFQKLYPGYNPWLATRRLDENSS